MKNVVGEWVAVDGVNKELDQTFIFVRGNVEGGEGWRQVGGERGGGKIGHGSAGLGR